MLSYWASQLPWWLGLVVFGCALVVLYLRHLTVRRKPIKWPESKTRVTVSLVIWALMCLLAIWAYAGFLVFIFWEIPQLLR